MPQSFKEFVESKDGWSLDVIISQLGYKSYYHFELVLDRRNQLLSDLCDGLLICGGVAKNGDGVVAECRKRKIPISRLAKFWGVSREYIYRCDKSGLLQTAFMAEKPKALANVELVRLPVNINHAKEISPAALLNELSVKRPLWRVIDCLAWWSPPDNGVQVRGLYGAFQGNAMNGPLLSMMMDAINGLPLAPPDFNQFGGVVRGNLISPDQLKCILKSKGWKKSDLCNRWNFKGMTHLYKTLNKCSTHPHISDAIHGLPPLIKASRILK